MTLLRGRDPSSTRTEPVRRIPHLLLAVLALVVIVARPPGADADVASDKAQREQVRTARARAAADVNVLKADRSQIETALRALDDEVQGQEKALSDAQDEVDQAETAQARAQRGIREATKRLGKLRVRMARQAVEAYINPRSDALGVVLDSSDASEAVRRQAVVDQQTDRDVDLSDQVRAAQSDLKAKRREAAQAERRARTKRAEVQTRLDKVKGARQQKQGFAAQVQGRIDAQIARAIKLGRQDRALSQKILREQAAIQARLVADRAERNRKARVAAARVAAARATAARATAARATADQAASARAAAPAPTPPARSEPTYDDGGDESAPIAPPGPPASAGSGSGGVSLCTVGGITVNCQIASSLQAMVRAAAGAGISLSGGGYRDPAQQIQLRREHCGSSYYAIYQMPSSQCSPPTAPPGSSQHELGLAIDFGNCSSRGSACFRWLSGNASSFGFFNLPSEPWHWSVNGN